MHTKRFFWLILMMIATACAPNTDIVQVTRPVATVMATAVAPTPFLTATSTLAPTLTAAPTLTLEPTLTLSPTAVSTPEFIWPTESIIFFNDDSLKKWSPQSGEVTVLAENVDWGPIYGADIVAFTREITPTEESALVILHIPTGSAFEVGRTSSRSFSFTVSPNGRWLAYISGYYDTYAPLFIHEIVVNEQHISVSDPILIITPDDEWDWLYGRLTWPTENQLSWNDPNGIWIADLEADSIKPTITIEPSTNTYKVPYMNPADRDKEPAIANTVYIPYQWSPDGRYLLAVESYYLAEGSSDTFRIIEKDTNWSFEIPDSGLGPISDAALWLDDTHLLHYKICGDLAYIWHINTNVEPIVELDNTFQIGSSADINCLTTDSWLALPNNHVRFAVHESHDEMRANGFFDLDTEQGVLSSINTELDGGYIQAQWSPNADHVVWSYAGKPETFLDDLNGDGPLDVSSIFGENSCCWYWYEE